MAASLQKVVCNILNTGKVNFQLTPKGRLQQVEHPPRDQHTLTSSQLFVDLQAAPQY